MHVQRAGETREIERPDRQKNSSQTPFNRPKSLPKIIRQYEAPLQVAKDTKHSSNIKFDENNA